MIQIDGNKIKNLREEQGLTQLYIATVVEVTTDTISRWENKRYPSIKQENGLKLAEALGVELESILLAEDETSKEEEGKSAQPSSSNTPQKRKSIPIVITAVLLICSATIAFFYFHKKPTTIEATRILPPTTVPNSPFPVIIEVKSSDVSSISLILKETLPANCSILQTLPALGSTPGKCEIKWIHKINGTSTFSYMAKITGKPGDFYDFSGSVATNQGAQQTLAINGDEKIQLGLSHWADTDGDNQISDQEILTVFDQYSGIDNLNIDIDLIERMWLGTSYTWDKAKNLITISP